MISYKNKKSPEKDDYILPKVYLSGNAREILENEMKTRALYGNGNIKYSESSTAIN